MNRLKAKIDKEIENKDIRKKLKNVQARVHSNILYNPNQMNVDKSGNLSGKNSARRTTGSAIRSDNERMPAAQLSPTKLQLEQNGQRRGPYNDSDVYMRNVHMIKPPLSMYMSSSFTQKPPSRFKKFVKNIKTKTTILPAISDNEPNEDDEKTSRSMRSIDDNYTPRSGVGQSSPSPSMCETHRSHRSSSRIPVAITPQHTAKMSARSMTKSQDCLPSPTALDMASLSSGSTTYLNLDLDLCSLSSPKDDEVYHMAPLLPAPSAAFSEDLQRVPNDTSAVLMRRFRNVLEREDRFMPEADINVVKNVLKSDERARLLKCQETDTKLFKDILKTQLDEIVKSEKVVKNALRMLGSSSSSRQCIEISKPIEVYNVTPAPPQRHTNKMKQRTFAYSNDSSPRHQSSVEYKEYSPGSAASKRRRHVATDTFSIDGYTSRNEIFKAYNERQSARKTNYTKNTTSQTTPTTEFEEFVKSTLPLKRKQTAASNEEASQQLVRRQPQSNDDLQVNLVRNQGDQTIDVPHIKEQRRPQVDVTFKNVPSVEKEIMILKALGKRLEETLKRSASEPSLSDNAEKSDANEVQSCSSDSSLTRELKKIDPSISIYPGRRSGSRPPVTRLRVRMFTTTLNTSRVGHVIFSKGVRLEMGVVKEFVIVAKTVNELLAEPNTEFFIANENEPGGLNPIPFEKLAEQPQTLVKYLKPKDPSTPFNILDQDSIFFNSYLLPNLKSKIRDLAEKKSVVVSKAALEEPPKITEGGDSLLVAKDALPAEKECEAPSCSNAVLETRSQHSRKVIVKKTKPRKTKLLPPMEPVLPQRTHQRGRVNRTVTPMPLDAFDDPKNNLIKTVVVGAVQASIFLVMIMAITFPDIKC